MILAEGNTEEFEALKKCSCETYLLKLENYIDKVVQLEKQAMEIKRKK